MLQRFHDMSGGNVLRRHTLHTRNRAGQTFRRAAPSVSRSHHGLGAFSRRMRARLGHQAAIVATLTHSRNRLSPAHTSHPVSRPERREAFEQRARARETAHVRQKAAKLDMTLVELPA
jgi:hypothetical protein